MSDVQRDAADERPSYPEVLSAYSNASGVNTSWTASAEAWTAATAFTRELLTLEHLVVITGLGTSIGVAGATGLTAPTMQDLWDRVATVPDFAAVVASLGFEPESAPGLEELLSLVQSVQSLDGTAVLKQDLPDLVDFMASAEAEILSACSFVDHTSNLDSHVAMLRVLASRGSRAHRAELFTTNYDLCFDLAADRAGVTLIDGFGFGSPRRYDPDYLRYELAIRDTEGRLSPAPRVVRYGKLHGSVDWDRVDQGAVTKHHQPTNPVLIYPRGSKLADSFQAPYLDGMARLQSLLRQRSVGVIVVGFGFGDLHLSEPIRHAVRSNPGLRLLAWAPDLRTRYEAKQSETLGTICRLIEKGDRRLGAVCGTFDDLLLQFPSDAEDDPVEAHLSRLRSIGGS